MKKLLLTIGSAASIIAPIAAVVSCGTDKAKNTVTNQNDDSQVIWDGVTEGKDYVEGTFEEEYTRTTPVKVGPAMQIPGEDQKKPEVVEPPKTMLLPSSNTQPVPPMMQTPPTPPAPTTVTLNLEGTVEKTQVMSIDRSVVDSQAQGLTEFSKMVPEYDYYYHRPAIDSNLVEKDSNTGAPVLSTSGTAIPQIAPTPSEVNIPKLIAKVTPEAAPSVKPGIAMKEDVKLKALDVILLIELLKEERKVFPKIANEALSFVEPKFYAMNLMDQGSFDELQALEKILEVSYNKIHELWEQLHPNKDAE